MVTTTTTTTLGAHKQNSKPHKRVSLHPIPALLILLLLLLLLLKTFAPTATYLADVVVHV